MKKNYFINLIFYLFLVFFAKNVSAQKRPSSLLKHRENYMLEMHKLFPEAELDFFEENQIFRIKATYEKLSDTTVVSMNTSAGKIKTFKPYAFLKFEIDGLIYNLTAYQSFPILKLYSEYIFIPFNDQTNGVETYGAGRYIDLKINDFKKRKVLLDFNKAYNPYCAFSDEYNCPIPPLENKLKLGIEAGEKKPKTVYK